MVFVNVKKIFSRIVLQHQEFFFYYGKMLQLKNTPFRYLLMKNVWKILNCSLFCLYFSCKLVKIRRRKPWMRQTILKRHSKLEFCVLVIMTWNYLIRGMLSSDFITFWVRNNCSQRNWLVSKLSIEPQKLNISILGGIVTMKKS